MELTYDTADFVLLIAEAFRAEFIETGTAYEFDLKRQFQTPTVTLEKSRLVDAISTLETLEVTDETTVWNPKSYEVLLRDESPFPRLRMRMRAGPLQVQDRDNDLLYTLSQPSDSYLLFLLMRVAAFGNAKRLVGAAGLFRFPERNELGGNVGAFEALRRIFSRFITLHIRSGRSRSALDHDRFANAFLFQLSYNVDAALVPQRHLDELVRGGGITEIRKTNIANIDPPRRHYIPDLVYHYQLGVAGDNPSSQYLSYYHIAEHFFEDVFNEDLVERIKHKITHPDFSYRRKKDIAFLIRDISRSLQVRNERITFSEVEALRLTLGRYLDVDSLRDELNAYDPTLIGFYRSSKVGFANSDEVDLLETNREALDKKLALRIYKVRNAIVHSKESDKARFMTFRDDRVLSREVPLLRFVAEQIIINTSSIV